MVTGPGMEIARPAVDMDMFHLRFVARDSFRDKDMILEQV